MYVYMCMSLEIHGDLAPANRRHVVLLVARHFDEARGAVILREAQLSDLACGRCIPV